MEQNWNFLFIYPLPAHLIPFPNTFIIKGSANNGRNPPSCPVKKFIKEEVVGCINEEAIGGISEAAIGAIIAGRNSPSYFFISHFTVSLAPSINRPDFSNDSAILIILSISSFEINKLNPFLYLTAPCPVILFSNLSNTEEVALVANLGKKSLAKGTVRSSNIGNSSSSKFFLFNLDIVPVLFFAADFNLIVYLLV